MRVFAKKLCILFFCIQAVFAWAQGEKRIQKNKANSVNTQVSKLSKTLEGSRSEESVANDYVDLAQELFNEYKYTKAEDYLERALKIYLKLKQNNRASTTYRELAKTQEAQQKIDLAVANYRKAAQMAENNAQKELNHNDANRLASVTDLVAQSGYIQQNINLSNTPELKKERAVAYQQMARVKMEQNDNVEAINQLESALMDMESESEAFKVRQDIAHTLVADKRYEDAIRLNKQLVTEAKETNNANVAISQIQNLGNVYFEANNPSKGFDVLQEAYALAINEGQTLSAKKVLEQLVVQYEKEHNTNKVLKLYADFIGRLDTLVKNDSTLVDAKFFQLHEEKIRQLEKERELKDELITRKNNYNYVLLISIVFVLIALAIISRILISNLKKNKKIALQALRREMNPHFIFNSLNSVNQFIAQNKELEANKYLSSYSRLMRNIMENSNKDFIPLSTEIEQIKEYLALEHQRFQDKFTYEIEIDGALDADHILIPNMLIQPQLENAIWHGLRYKEGAGLLLLNVHPDGERVCVTIHDNGIGLKKSQALKTAHQKAHRSRGITNTYERIGLLNNLYHVKISIDIQDKEGEQSGVIVTLCFPLLHKTFLKAERDGSI